MICRGKRTSYPRSRHGVWAGTYNPNDPCCDWNFGLVLEGWPSKIQFSWGSRYIYIYIHIYVLSIYFPIINHKLRKAIVGWSSWSQVDGNWQKAFLWCGAKRWFFLLFQNLHNPIFSSISFGKCTKNSLHPPKRCQIRSPGEWLCGVLGSLTKPWRASVRPDTGWTAWVTRNRAAVGWGRFFRDCRKLGDWIPQITGPSKMSFPEQESGLVPLVRRQFWECAAFWMI